MESYDWLFDVDTKEVIKIKTPKKKRKLKAGDKVRIKSLDWYNANKNESGDIPVYGSFVSDMAQYCGREFIIRDNNGLVYHLQGVGWNWSEEMFDLD